MVYPRIALTGGQRERGRQYGEAAGERIERSLAAYRDVFHHYAGWDWGHVRHEAAGFMEPMERDCGRYLEEMRGIAEGAGIELIDILAINVRTEVMFAASARDVSAPRPPAECSSFAVLPRRAAGRAVLVGQNWDWLVHSIDTAVVLEVRPDSGPAFVTVVEAGLLAKCGMNAAGLAVTTNALVCEADTGRPGVPYHVLLRALLDCESVRGGLALLQRVERASSANYLLADADGFAIDIEAVAGDYSRLLLQHPTDGVLLHTNHFLSPRFGGRDISLVLTPDSPFRLDRLRELLADSSGPIDVAQIRAALVDHAGFPSGVCCHADPTLPPLERSITAASVVMDLGARQLWLASGNPCDAAYEQLDYAAFLRGSAAESSIAVAPGSGTSTAS